MRLIYLLCCAFMVQTTVDAQVIDQFYAPAIGDTWGAIFLPGAFDRADVGLPLAGEANATFDFRFLGDAAALVDGTTLDMVPIDSMVSVRMLPPPTAAEFGADEVVPDFPAGTIGTDDGIFEIGFQNLDDDNFEVSFLLNEADGVKGIGFGCVEEGEYFDVEVDDQSKVTLLPYGLTLGQTLEEVNRDTTIEDGDTVISVDSSYFEVLGTGLLRTPYGDFENAVVLREFFFSITEGDFGFFSSRVDNVNFYAPNNFRPIVSLFKDEELNENGEFIDPDIQVIVYRPLNLSSTAEADRERLQLSAYPNPVTEELRVDFSSEAGSATLSLRTIDGQLLKQQTYAGLGAGQETLRFAIPGNVTAGSYLIQVEQAGITTALPVVVKR